MNKFFGFRTALLVVFLAGCGETVDNVDSSVSCSDYCAKSADCREVEPTSEENTACQEACRNNIEDNCGNDMQSQANDLINTCVDLACDDFWPCLVLDEAPECLAFVEDERPAL